MSITVYLCLLGLWTSGYVRTERRAPHGAAAVARHGGRCRRRPRRSRCTSTSRAPTSCTAATSTAPRASSRTPTSTARSSSRRRSSCCTSCSSRACSRSGRAAQAARAQRPGARRHDLVLARRVAEPRRGRAGDARGAAAAPRRRPSRERPAGHARGLLRRGRGSGGRVRVVELPGGARASTVLRHPALRRPARRHRARASRMRSASAPGSSSCSSRSRRTARSCARSPRRVSLGLAVLAALLLTTLGVAVQNVLRAGARPG